MVRRLAKKEADALAATVACLLCDQVDPPARMAGIARDFLQENGWPRDWVRRCMYLADAAGWGSWNEWRDSVEEFLSLHFQGGCR